MTEQESMPSWPRFFHWVIVDVPEHLREIPPGAVSPHSLLSHLYGREGLHDRIVIGNFGRRMGYRGPCRVLNDVDYYQIHVFGVDVPKLNLPIDYFDGREVLAKLPRHVTSHGFTIANYTRDPTSR